MQHILEQPAIKYFLEKEGHWFTAIIVEKSKSPLLSASKNRKKQKSRNWKMR